MNSLMWVMLQLVVQALTNIASVTDYTTMHKSPSSALLRFEPETQVITVQIIDPRAKSVTHSHSSLDCVSSTPEPFEVIDMSKNQFQSHISPIIDLRPAKRNKIRIEQFLRHETL